MSISVFLELFMKYGSEFGTVISFTILAAIMTYMQKDSVKSRKHSDEKFNQVLSSQDEMKREYREGFIKVNTELKGINERIDDLDEKQSENNLLALRSIITNTSLPIDYRLASFDTYVEKGGNSWIHDYVKKEIFKERSEEL